jgi:hypothetical protein
VAHFDVKVGGVIRHDRNMGPNPQRSLPLPLFKLAHYPQARFLEGKESCAVAIIPSSACPVFSAVTRERP